jgi:hypothetical protein
MKKKDTDKGFAIKKQPFVCCGMEISLFKIHLDFGLPD